NRADHSVGAERMGKRLGESLLGGWETGGAPSVDLIGGKQGKTRSLFARTLRRSAGAWPGPRRARLGVVAMIGAILACRVGGLVLTGLRGKGRPIPLLVVGLDGADWEVIRPLIREGRLPHLARLVGEGTSGTLLSEPPLLSPIIWTTLATGRPPTEHGITSF